MLGINLQAVPVFAVVVAVLGLLVHFFPELDGTPRLEYLTMWAWFLAGWVSEALGHRPRILWMPVWAMGSIVGVVVGWQAFGPPGSAASLAALGLGWWGLRALRCGAPAGSGGQP